MNSGVFCRPKSSTNVYNSILIDEYHKCIFGEEKVEPAMNTNIAPGDSSAAKMSEETDKWEVGMNVRAPFTCNDNEEYYEAKIIKILDDKYATVEFLGYNDEQVVKLNELKNSEGEKAIEEQIAKAEQEYEEDEDYDDEDEDQIDWKVGMLCRAYYKPMDLIYEATIEEVDSTNQTATVVMIGYKIRYVVDFCDLHRSDPTLREKQIRSAAIHMAEKAHSSSLLSQNQVPHEGKSFDVSNSKVTYREPTNSKSQPSQSIGASSSHSQERIIQPKDENEALACLVSANYLCGYYAGYYDCLKKVAK